MSEDATTPAPAGAIPPAEAPAVDETGVRATRPYIINVFGLEFAVEGTRKENVVAHLAARLRREAEVRLATFEDGIACGVKGIPLEYAGQNESLELFTDGES